MAKKIAAVKLIEVIIRVGGEFDLKKIEANVRKRKFKGVGKLLPQTLRKILPKTRIVSGKNRDTSLPDCIVFGELENGIYLLQFLGGKPLHIMIFGRHNRWIEMLWIDGLQSKNLIRYLPHAEGGIYPHCSDPVENSEIRKLLTSYEPRAEILQQHKLLVSALAV